MQSLMFAQSKVLRSFSFLRFEVILANIIFSITLHNHVKQRVHRLTYEDREEVRAYLNVGELHENIFG